MHPKPAYWLTCVLILVASSLSATTIVMPADEQLIAKAPVIVRGTVLSSSAAVENGAIYTDTILEVDSVIKGEAPAAVSIREIGGIAGDRITKVFGTPDYLAGEHVLVFLRPKGEHFRTVDLFAGKFSEERRRDGGRVWQRDTQVPNVEIVGHDLQPVQLPDLDRDADRFETYVSERAAGREGTRNYFVPKAGTKLRTESNFTLIDEPNVYRWASFDSGTTARWYSYGSQSGYTGNGISELRTAMSSWTSLGNARILYSYDGAFTTSPGGLSRANGRNEVLFGDPLDEIDGTFNASTGGVVGTGGFSGVSGSQNWTGPFAADGTHTTRTYRAWTITEGNLTIQDGVTPSARISATRLAEIVSHEFGHTLGIGHSADNTALMYASITGLGPSLRADDQTAARWLYPVTAGGGDAGGGGTTPTPNPTPTIPGAPTSLTAFATGGTIDLQWSDNATNEAGQAIYMSSGGSYARYADVGVNVRSATLSGFAPGTYSFYVVAFNSAGTSTPSNVVSLTIAAPAPPLVASFSWSPANPFADDPITFNDTSTGGVTTRFWNFGDGSSSTQASPAKRYSAAGSYSVTLTIYRGGESRVAAQTVTVGQRSPVTPNVEPYRSVIPVTAQTDGIGGSVWRTELTLFNAGNEGVSADLVFVPGAGGAVLHRWIFLSPRQTLSYANALRDVFGMSAGSGAIAVEATGATAMPQLKIMSRTFNDAGGGTYGLAVPDIGNGAMQQTMYITGLVSNDSFRTNVGLVNRSSAAVSATLLLREANGSTVATTTVTIPASNFQQTPLSTLFPAIGSRPYDTLSLRINASSGNSLSAYVSVVDNRTQDPVYMQALPAPAGTELTIPVVGRVPGASNTFWRSDVVVHNPTSAWMAMVLRFGSSQRSIVLMPNETTTIADVVSTFGVDSGTGALFLDWSGSTGPVVTSRNYTTVAGGGTYGQSIDAAAVGVSETFVTGLRSDGSFRTNAGFVNTSDGTIHVEVTILSSIGAVAGRNTFQLGPRAQLQQSISSLFPGVDVSNLGNFTLQARAGSAALLAYGTVIDNGSGDPAFFAGR